MRISDWSSDVCSSDLLHGIAPPHNQVPARHVDILVRHDSDTIASLSPGDILLETNQTGYRRLDAGGQNSNRIAHGQPAARQLARIAPKAVGAVANDPLDKKPGRPVRPRCADRQGLQQDRKSTRLNSSH